MSGIVQGHVWDFPGGSFILCIKPVNTLYILYLSGIVQGEFMYNFIIVYIKPVNTLYILYMSGIVHGDVWDFPYDSIVTLYCTIVVIVYSVRVWDGPRQCWGFPR
jgi:hypothetical protein